MSIDFATIKSLEIPEGKVKQITDANGIVLWNAVKNAKVTITSQWDGFDGDSASITVKSPTPFAPDPSNPNNKVTSWTVFVYDQPNRTIEVPVGSTIECTISRDKGNAESYISLNGTNMVTGEGTYIYTVTGDVTIAIKELYTQGDYGVITIIEAGVAVLQVEKITDDTYVNDTVHTGDTFVMLDIYPKDSNSTVNVTYGGLTKTLQFEGTNAQQVYFGTFGGVSDSVTTPASGEVTIEGGFSGYGCGTYKADIDGTKCETAYCPCITGVTEWGSITSIPDYAFYNCIMKGLTSLPEGITSIGSHAFYGWTVNLTLTHLPNSIKSIGSHAFYLCTKLALSELPSGITSIGDYAFCGCSSIALTSLPSGLTKIGNYTFSECTNLALTSLPNGITSIGNYAFYRCWQNTFSIFPEGLTSIGDYAFFMGTNKPQIVYPKIKDIILPTTLTSIGDYCFAYEVDDFGNDPKYYNTLNTIKILATTPPTIEFYTFGMLGSNSTTYFPTITVPKGCGEIYKTTGYWGSHYADGIVEASE